MIVKNDGPVNMTLQDLLKMWLHLIPTEMELTHMTPGGDQDVNLYLLEVTNGKAI